MRKSKETKNVKRTKAHQKKRLQDQGVTMIALVVTIIILLILSGITIRFVVGEDGVIGQAREASLKYQNSSLQEQLLLNSLDEQIADISNGSGNSSGNGSSDGSSDGNGSSDGSSNNGNSDDQATINNLQRQVNTLKEKLAEAESERDKSESEIAELENKISSLENQINSLQSQNIDLNSQIISLQAKQASGNATASDVLEGKTFSNSSSVGLTGTIPNNGDVSKTLELTEGNTVAYTIPTGYTTGGTITAKGTVSDFSFDNLKNMQLVKSISRSGGEGSRTETLTLDGNYYLHINCYHSDGSMMAFNCTGTVEAKQLVVLDSMLQLHG